MTRMAYDQCCPPPCCPPPPPPPICCRNRSYYDDQCCPPPPPCCPPPPPPCCCPPPPPKCCCDNNAYASGNRQMYDDQCDICASPPCGCQPSGACPPQPCPPQECQAKPCCRRDQQQMDPNWMNTFASDFGTDQKSRQNVVGQSGQQQQQQTRPGQSSVSKQEVTPNPAQQCPRHTIQGSSVGIAGELTAWRDPRRSPAELGECKVHGRQQLNDAYPNFQQCGRCHGLKRTREDQQHYQLADSYNQAKRNKPQATAAGYQQQARHQAGFLNDAQRTRAYYQQHQQQGAKRVCNRNAGWQLASCHHSQRQQR